MAPELTDVASESPAVDAQAGGVGDVEETAKGAAQEVEGESGPDQEGDHTTEVLKVRVDLRVVRQLGDVMVCLRLDVEAKGAAALLMGLKRPVHVLKQTTPGLTGPASDVGPQLLQWHVSGATIKYGAQWMSDEVCAWGCEPTPHSMCCPCYDVRGW